jgi:hypothetical protein
MTGVFATVQIEKWNSSKLKRDTEWETQCQTTRTNEQRSFTNLRRTRTVPRPRAMGKKII